MARWEGRRAVVGGATARKMAVVVALLAALAPAAWAEPSAGQLTTQLYSPTPTLPDEGTFDLLLMDLARPPGNSPRGMTTSSASLAIRAHATSLAPAATPDDLGVVGNPALEVPLNDVPAGNAVFDLLAPGSTSGPGGLKVKDVGRLVLAHDGPLARTSRAVFGPGEYRDVAVGAAGVLLSGALIARLGTARAQGLGIMPGVSLSFLGGALTQDIRFHCDPKLKNPGLELSSRYHLLHVQAPHISPWVKDVYAEAGVTAQRNTGAGFFPTRFFRLRLGNDRLDAAVTYFDPPDRPPSWILEAVGHQGAFRTHLTLSREDATGIEGATADVMLGRPDRRAGLFFGARSGQGLSTGILAMALF